MSQAVSSSQVGEGRMEGEGERGIGCQKAPIANEMEEDDGAATAKAKNERDSGVESAMLRVRAAARRRVKRRCEVRRYGG